MEKINGNKIWLSKEDYINYLAKQTNKVHLSTSN